MHPADLHYAYQYTNSIIIPPSRDVRTREVGIQDIHHRVRPDEVELIRRDYTANNGWETFLEYGDPRQDILIGLLRLRKISGRCGWSAWSHVLYCAI